MCRKIILIIIFLATKAEAQTSALAIADSLYAVGNYSKAIKELQALPQSEAVMLKLAEAQKAQGNISAALLTYEKVFQKEPERVLATFEYAKLLSAAGELQKADRLLRGLVDKDRTNPNFHYQLGLVREKLKDSTAVKYYQYVVAFNPIHQKALEKLARYNLSNGKLILTEILCKQGLKANPGNVTLLSLLAQAFYHMKEYELAIGEFEKLEGMGAANEFVHTKIGTAYALLEQYDEAIAHFNSALDYQDKNPETHYSLGKLYALKGEYENSEGHLLQALLLKDVLVDEELTSLGLTYKLQEKPKEAFTYFNRAVEENPENERAMYERAVAADSYYKDLKTRLNYYQLYLDKFRGKGNRNLVTLAEYRIQDLKEEIHLNAAKRESK